MKTTLEIVVALATGLLLSGAWLALGALGTGALAVGGGWWLVRVWRRLHRK